ncbi:acyl-CoA N-acyltransferase [Biscogniauxia marginata]|nr:acyl-CoA N-acyltransferase [Biscogniauxia marginata]
MPLELQPATEADARRAVEIEALAYAPSPFNAILFPGPFPPEARDFRAAELAKEMKEDATARWLKIVDMDLEGDGEQKMIAFAKWHVYADGPTPGTSRTFGPGCNAEACEMLFGGTARLKTALMGDKPYVYLRFLHTDPKHQDRGAGTMLVKWGLEEAKKLGLVAYLESSEAGHSLYKKCGFRDVECLSVDLSRWGATTMHNTWSMTCDP